MYCLVPEKPLRLVYGTFYLAIGVTFYEFILIKAPEKNGVLVPSLCRSGECSMCRVKITSGKVFQPHGIPVRASDKVFGYVHSSVSFLVTDMNIHI